MKYLSSRMIVVALLAGGLIAACNSSAFAQDTAATYESKCAVCHGPDGKGSAAGAKMGVHDFMSAEVQGQSDAQLTEIITKGKGKMPGYGSKLKDSEIKDLVGFIRGLKK